MIYEKPTKINPDFKKKSSEVIQFIRFGHDW